MFCESYRRGLIDSLAAGEPLPPALAEHLAGCDVCSTAFAREQALYAAIDYSLVVRANAPVPPSLLPRVRAQIAAPPDKAFWRAAILAFATLPLVAVAAALSPVFHWRSARSFWGPENHQAATPKVQFADNHAATRSPGQPAPLVKQYAPTSKPGSVVLSHSKVRAGTEVLISPEEQAGLERYALDLRGKALENGARAASVANDTAFKIEPLLIPVMDQQQLTIEPLESDEYN
jgi:hypothetical protein